MKCLEMAFRIPLRFELLVLLFLYVLHGNQVLGVCNLQDATEITESKNKVFIAFNILCKYAETGPACVNQGYSSPAITESAENDELITATNGSPRGFWLGAKRILTKWHSVNGDLKDQNTIKHMNEQDRYCGARKHLKSQIQLTARSCGSPFRFVCQKKDCEAGEDCIFVSNVTKSWYDARKDCWMRSQQLADYNILVPAEIPGELFWIDLKKETWLQERDGEELQFTNWKRDQPSSQTEMCLEGDPSGKWNDRNCDDKNFVLCLNETAPKMYKRTKPPREYVLPVWLRWTLASIGGLIVICIVILITAFCTRSRVREYFYSKNRRHPPHNTSNEGQRTVSSNGLAHFNNSVYTSGSDHPYSEAHYEQISW